MTKHHVLYINMDRDADRESLLLERLGSYFDGTATCERIRGVEVTDDNQTKELMDPEYKRDNGKTMTLGEIGCALSHVKAWKRVVELGHPCIIVEDDVVSYNHNFLATLEELESPPVWLYEPEFVYLGRQAMDPDNEKSFCGSFKVPRFSWLLHAYWLSPKGASKLLATKFKDCISVVDDYVPVMLGHGPEMDFAKKYEEAEKLKALAFTKPLLWQIHSIGLERTINSRTENSPMVTKPAHEETYGLATIATDEENPGLKLLNTSLKQNDWIYCSNIGSESKWRDDMSGKGGGKKLHLMKAYIDSLNELGTDPNTIIIFVDGYDMFTQTDPATVVQRFRELEHVGKVIFSAESTLWPENNDIESTMGDYLNSGGYIGRLRDISKILSDLPEEIEDDQEFMHYYWKDNPDSIVLDRARKIFYCLNDGMQAHIIDGVFHLDNGTVPCFVHGNGDHKVKTEWAELADIVTKNKSPTWIGPKTHRTLTKADKELCIGVEGA